MAKSNRSRSFPLLALCLLLVLGGAMALLWRSPAAVQTSAAAQVDLQTAIVQAREALRGVPSAFDGLQKSLERLKSTTGANADPVVRQVDSSARTIFNARQEVLGAYAIHKDLEQKLSVMRRDADELQFAAAQPAVSSQVKRLNRAAGHLLPGVRALIAGAVKPTDISAKPTDIANQLGETEVEIRDILISLQSGDPALGLKPVTGARAVDALGKLNASREKVIASVRQARALGDRLDVVSQAARQLDGLALRIVGAAAPVATEKPELPQRELMLMGLLGVAAVLLLFMAWSHFRTQDAPTADTGKEDAERNQQAILKLLDELASLADGDLTVQATVTEDITGAIADSINYAVDALRELVITINESAILLDGAAKTAETTAAQLGQASEAQSKQVDSASGAIGRMVNSIEEVSGDAERSSDVARHSVDVAHKGGEAVRRTIAGMNTIRETIQDTSKRIKRLGESSQEIGNIVELINDIADQTNILALNASIQASMAGEAGRGFAVVADEVQRLAERSANATKQIEVLVRTIQADTNEAIVSMERSTTDVVGGALLAENAGAALEEIEQVSSQIASLVQNISNSARDQSGAAAAVIRIVELLQQINAQTASGTNTTRESISKLAALAAQLRRSVAGFRLPAPVAAEVRRGESRAAASPARGGGGEEAEYTQRTLRVLGKKTA